MNIKIKNLVIGAGNSGLMAAYNMEKNDTIVIDKSFYSKNDYFVFLRNKYPFTDKGVECKTEHHYNNDFNNDFFMKLYGVKNKQDVAFKDSDARMVYQIKQELMVDRCNIYGNIDVKSIDIKNKIVCCVITHIGKTVSFKYENLINTIPIFRFSKLCGIDLLNDFGLFISYYPIGILKRKNNIESDIIKIDYFSDPLIDFYRTHKTKGITLYEYCINKVMNIRFDMVSVPGKFIDVDKEKLLRWADFCTDNNIYMASRFAAWNTEFLIEDIISPRKESTYYENISKMIKVTS